MLTSLVLEALVLLKAILAALTRYYTAIMAKLDVIDAKVDNLDNKVSALAVSQDEEFDEIERLLAEIEADTKKILEAVVPSPATSIRMLITMDGKFVQEGTLPMSQIITATQKFLASVSFVDAKGNPAVVEGAPVFAASDPAILSIVATASPNAVEVLAVGPVGTAQVSVTADADLGEGIKPVIGLLDVQVVAGEAVSVAISAGAPIEQ